MVLKNVTKRYGRRGALTPGACGAGPALDRVTLSFAAGSVTAVLGVSGSGKWPHPVRILLGLSAAGGAGTLMAFTFGQKSAAGQLALALPLAEPG